MTSLPHPSARLVDASSGDDADGAHLQALINDARAWMHSMPDGVAFLPMSTSMAAVIQYLAAWKSRRAVALLDPYLDRATLDALVTRYRPAIVIDPIHERAVESSVEGYDQLADTDLGTVRARTDGGAVKTHPDLAVLLATSGSTGDPKLVRLSRAAVEANTASIVQALAVTGADVAITTLPFFYSFGMSVLNTHLAAGGTLVLTSEGLLAKAFWDAIDRYGVTSLAMVPTQYEMLRRIRFDPSTHPTIRTLTQAGGHLSTEAILGFHRRIASCGGQMYVMYGQTEGGPRLTTLPAEALPQDAGSVGPAVPGGRLSIELADGTETATAGVVGQVIYRGPNVMMGYAQDSSDLSLGDVLGGRLATGDIGRLDERGYLTIEGRLSRVGKVFGVRINLDDVERLMEQATGQRVAVVAGNDRLVVWVEGVDPAVIHSDLRALARRLRLHWSGFETRGVDVFPMSANRKIDYRALEALA